MKKIQELLFEWQTKREQHAELTNKANYKHNDELNWWKLDNAALIYPSSTSNTWPGVFRISIYLKNDEQVKAGVLQKAVDDIMPRFPFYNVRLKKGLFWFYFEEQPFTPRVKEETNYPCRKFDINSRKHLIRVLYYRNKISFECFHSLCDGRGAVKFVTALLMRYFEIQGIKISDKDKFVNYLDLPQPEEGEDSFERYADLKETQSRKGRVAYEAKGTPLEFGKQLNFTAIMDVNQLKSVAKAKGATLTEYLVAQLMLSANDQRKLLKVFNRPVAVQVPIDCRQFFPSETIRNFSSFKFIVMPETEDFAEIAQSIRAQLAEIDADYIMRNINANVKAAKNAFVKFVPLPLKSLGLRFSSRLFGERLSTTTISNIGLIKAPPEILERVDFMECMLGRSRYNNYCSGCCTINNKLTWTITSKIKETQIYTQLFKRISDDGIDIELISNKEL